MQMTRCHAYVRGLVIALGMSVAGFLSGCGSGTGSLPSVPQKPGTPVTPPISQTQGPQLGYFWNSSDQTLRPITGVPGSSQVGASVVTAGTYVNGASSFASGLAVMILPDGSLDVIALPSGSPVHVATTVAKDAQIRFSPNGKTAVVYSAGADSLLLVTSLAATPSAATLHATAVQEAAVSDTGHVAVGSSNAVQMLATTGAGTQVGTVGALGGLAFGAGDNLVFTDSAANTLTVVRNASTTPTPSQLATTGLLKAPVALNVSPNGQWVLVANSGEASTVRVDLSAQTAPLLISCSCTPALVIPMSATGAFRVTAPTDGPLWAIDAAVATPRAFFVPAVHP